MMFFSKFASKNKKPQSSKQNAFKNSFYQTANRRMLVEQLERREVFDAGWTVSTTNASVWAFDGDSAGNHYLAGHFTSAATFGSLTLPSSGTQDIFVAKQASNGGFIWAVKAGSAADSSEMALATASDSLGNIFVVGKFAGTAQFGSHTLVSSGGSDGFLAKLNGTTGEFLWAKRFGAELQDEVRGVSIDSNDDVLVVGGFGAASFIAKLTSNGQSVWDQSIFGDGQTKIQDVEVDSDNSIYAAGFFSGTVNTPMGSFTSTATIPNSSGRPLSDGLVIKLDSNGTYSWAKPLQGNATKSLSTLALGPGGAVYVAGSFEGTINFDGISWTSAGSADNLVAKLDGNSGNVQWVQRLGGEGQDAGTVSLAVDNAGSLVVTAPTYSVNTTLGSQTIAATQYNTLLLTFASAGALIDSYVAVGGYATLPKGLHFDAAGNLYMASIYGLPATSGNSAAHPPHQTLAAAGGYVIKLPMKAPTKFFVVDESSIERTYNYSATGELTLGQFKTNNLPNSTIRGAASNASGSNLWLGERSGYVLNYSTSGAYLGSWKAGSLGTSPVVEGVATNGTDMWIVDNASDKVFRYTGAASRTSGTQNAVSSFKLNGTNKNPKGITTDGTNIWVVDDAATDRIFKYTMTGAFVGSWTIDSANKSPTGLTLDPTNGSQHIWIVDNGTDRIYQYNDARSRNSGSQSAATTFALAVGNTNPQGIADPPPPGTEIAIDNSSASSKSNELIGLPAEATDKTMSKVIVSSASDSKANRSDSAIRNIAQPSVRNQSSLPQKTPDSIQTKRASKPDSACIDKVFAEFHALSYNDELTIA